MKSESGSESKAPPSGAISVDRTDPALRWAGTFLTLVLAVSIILSWRGFLPTWGDEAFTVRLSHESWARFWTEIQNDVHPPLYFALNKLAVDIVESAGDSINILLARLISYLVLITLIWFTIGLVSRRVRKPRDLIFPALLIASSAHLALFGPMMRYYGLSALGVTVATLLLLPPTRIPPHWPEKVLIHRAFWYGVSLVVALYSAYLSAVVIPAHIIWLLTRPKVDARPFWKSLIGVGIASLPLLWLLAIQLKHGAETTSPGLSGMSTGAIARMAFTIWSFLIGEFIPPWNLWLTIPVFAAFLFLVFLAWRNRKTELSNLLWITLGISLVLGVAGLAYVGVGVEFCASRLFFLAPLFLVLLALGLSADGTTIPMRRAGSIAATVLIIANLYSTFNFATGTGWVQSTYIIPWRQISADIERLGMEDTVILYDDETLIYWLPYTGIPVPSIDLRRGVGDYNIIGDPPHVSRAIAVYSPRDDSVAQNVIDHLNIYNSGWEPDPSSTIEYLHEDETGMRWKSMLLGRQIYEVKKILIVYNASG